MNASSSVKIWKKGSPDENNSIYFPCEDRTYVVRRIQPYRMYSFSYYPSMGMLGKSENLAIEGLERSFLWVN